MIPNFRKINLFNFKISLNRQYGDQNSKKQNMSNKYFVLVLSCCFEETCLLRTLKVGQINIKKKLPQTWKRFLTILEPVLTYKKSHKVGVVVVVLKFMLETLGRAKHSVYGLFSPATAQIRKTEGKYDSWILN